MQPLPSPDDFQCFIEVARLSSFREAARALAVTPGAVSQRVRRLEELIGVELFTRTTRSVVLTQAGHALLPRAHAALRATEEAVSASRGPEDQPPVELQLGTRHELGMSWIVPMLTSFTKEMPWLTLHLYFGSGADLLLRVRSLQIDCAVTSTRLTDPKLDSRILHDEHYVFVAAPSLLERVRLRNKDDCRRHTLLDTTEALPLFRYLRDAPGGIGDVEFAATRRLGTISAIRAVVRQGDGVAALPAYYVSDDLERGRLRRVLPKAPISSDQFRLVFRADDPRASHFELMAAHMRQRPLK